MQTLMLASLVVLLVSCEAMVLQNLHCTDVCKHHHHYTVQQITFCGCPQHHHNHQIDTVSDTTTMQTTTTVNVCNYLCSIQMGGSACDCSIAIVPGRK